MHLLNEIHWEQDAIMMFGKKVLQPRKHAWYGDFLIRQNKIAQGMGQLDQHLSIVDRLMEAEPDNWQWTEQGTRSRIGYAEILLTLNHEERATIVGREAVSLGERLVRHDVENTRWKSLLTRARSLER